jgi:hypothetical protein
MADEDIQADAPPEKPHRGTARPGPARKSDVTVQPKAHPDKSRRITVRPIDDEDEDEVADVREKEPGLVGTMIPTKNPLALIAYYVGVFSILPIGLVTAPIALVLGLLGLMYSLKHPTARGMGHAITGVICGLIFTGIYWWAAVYIMKNGVIAFLDLLGL